MNLFWRCLIATAIVLPETATALGSHEVVLIVNSNSPRSVAVAGRYSTLRSIPASNIIFLETPWSHTNAPVNATHEEFTRHVWEPANRTIRDRRIGDHVLAWVYSIDFPTTIACPTRLSITALTFLRNVVPEPDHAEKALYVSPLFEEPSGAERPRTLSSSFDVSKRWLRRRMPLPAMSLGFAGIRGNDVETILARLADGAACDGTMPTGTVYLLVNDDIRTRCRQWQFKPSAAEINAAGARTVVIEGNPPEGASLIGVMSGDKDIQPAKLGRFMPGAIGDNLTSAAGDFSSPNQTKLSKWISAGAVASAGTVCEPMSAWQKFPTAWIFLHYARGCTAIESYYQSVRCPLQLLIVGDPLASPWNPAGKLLIDAPRTPLTGLTNIKCSVVPADDRLYTSFMALLDGTVLEDNIVAIDNSGDFTIVPSTSNPGEHILRVVAYGSGSVRHQIFSERTIFIGKPTKEE